MWFLILQILFLLLLAALAGGALVYWWFRNHYEDVTETHASLRRKAMELGDDRLTRGDLERSVSTLVNHISKIDTDPDLSGIDDRLLGIESAVAGIALPETDLGPLLNRLDTLEDSLSNPDESITTLHSNMTNLENAVARVLAAVSMLHNADFSGVEAKIETLRQKVDGFEQPDIDLMAARLSRDVLDATPDVDLSPVQQRLSDIEEKIAAITIPETDLDPIKEHLERLEYAILNIEPAETVDLSGVHQQISALETRFGEIGDRLRTAHASDLEAVHAGFTALSSSIESMEMPDLEPVRARLQGLETSVASIEPLETRIASLQDMIANQKGPDLSPIVASVRSLDSRRDLVALENRLTAIEYGLAAVHHMLRSRAEPRGFRSNGEQMYDISSPGDFSSAASFEARPARNGPPPRPARSADPINPARKPQDRANLLVEPAFGKADDLTRISGVGPMLSEMLDEIGVYYFWQIAEWSDEEIDWVDSQLLHFSGRILRDDWVGQARALALEPDAAKRPVAFGERREASGYDDFR